MRTVLKFLSHPALQGVGAVSSVAALILSVYNHRASYQDAPQPPPGLPSPPPAHPSAPGSNDHFTSSNLINEGLRSIDPGYHGMRGYLNDALLVGALAEMLLIIGIGDLVINRLARARLKRDP